MGLRLVHEAPLEDHPVQKPLIFGLDQLEELAQRRMPALCGRREYMLDDGP